MTKWDEMRKIVKQDCGAAGRYIDENGATCVIGALALAAGVPKETLLAYNFSTLTQFPETDAIIKHFEITFPTEVLMALQYANDSGDSDVTLRRERVLAIIDREEARERRHQSVPQRS